MVKLPLRFLAQTGIVIAAAAAILGVSVSPASAFSSPETVGKRSELGLNRPTHQDPVETRIELAIEEVNREGQDALEELGELDTPEKVQRAEEILRQMQRTAYEIRKRAHDGTADRFDELNDGAIGKRADQARAELRGIGEPDTPEKRARAEAVRTHQALVRAQLEERWENQRQRMAQRRDEQALPRADFRLPNGRPPSFAAAHGLRLRLEKLTREQAREQADVAIAQLELEGRHASERLGELDTPGKLRRAEKIRAALAARLHEIRQRAANQNTNDAGDPDIDRNMDQLERVYEQRAHQLQLRAQAAIDGLGEMDTPEKQDQARQIKAKLDEALAALRERLSNGTDGALEERLERETQSLRRRAEAALDEMGELDTPERQETARRVRERLEAQVQKLREQLARRTEAANFEEGADPDYDGLRRESAAALKGLGRLDTPEKVQQARLIRARLEDTINRLKHQRARQLNAGSGPPRDVLTEFLENRESGGAGQVDGSRQADPQDHADRARQAQEKARAALRQQRETLARINDRLLAEQERARANQAVTPTPDRAQPSTERGVRPTATPEPTRVEPAREAEPAENDSTSDSDSSGSDLRSN